MNILVLNCGSSSLTYKVFVADLGGSLQVVCSGKAHRVGVRGLEPSFLQHRYLGDERKQEAPIPNHVEAVRLILQAISDDAIRVDAIGHRIVHGGSYFRASALITDVTLAEMKKILHLAPLHNPNALSVIDEVFRWLPGIPQYLAFDTSFHSSLAPEIYRYALPDAIVEKHGFRRYGFHGLSYRYVTAEVANILQKPVESLKLVACHLGTGGSSLAAIAGGKSVDTTMGFTPVSGVMMSTRTGDVDPILMLYLLRQGISEEDLDTLVNKKSGLLAISGISSDVRDLIQAMETQNHELARLAFEMYAYHIKKAIGSLIALLGGIDALVFTDDIGVQNSLVRRKSCENMAWCGIVLDDELNSNAPVDCPTQINSPAGAVAIFSMPTDEEMVIARDGLHLLPEVQNAGL